MVTDDGGPGSGTAGREAPGVSLRVVEHTLGDRSLSIRCELSNASGQDVYAFASLPRFDEDGDLVADPDGWYVLFGPDRLLRIARLILPVPPWKRVEAPEIPFLVKLAAGGTRSDRIRLRVPVRCRDPYEDNYPEDLEPSETWAKGWRVEVGVLAAGTPSLAPYEPAGAGLCTVGYSAGLAAQRVVSTNTFAERLGVLDPARRLERRFRGRVSR